VWIGLLMLALGIGSTLGALLHCRDASAGKPKPYPLLYDVLGAVGFLAFGVGTLLNRPFFAGSGRLLLLLLIPIAFLKWRGLLGRR
jgi:hypothetical protein